MLWTPSIVRTDRHDRQVDPVDRLHVGGSGRLGGSMTELILNRHEVDRLSKLGSTINRWIVLNRRYGAPLVFRVPHR